MQEILQSLSSKTVQTNRSCLNSSILELSWVANSSPLQENTQFLKGSNSLKGDSPTIKRELEIYTTEGTSTFAIFQKESVGPKPMDFKVSVEENAISDQRK